MALEKKDYDMAIKYYEKAAGLKPAETYPKNQMDKAAKAKETEK